MIQFGYLTQVGIILLGFSIWFTARFVLFEQRKGKLKYFIITLIGVCIIIINFLYSLIISIVQVNSIKFGISLIILFCSGIYFIIVLKFKIFKKINLKLDKRKLEWSKKGKYLKIKLRIFKYSLIFWLIISISLITMPYPIYFQKLSNFYSINPSPKTDLGIWTYGQSLNDDNKDEPEYIDDETLEMLGEADVYFIYGVNEKKIGRDLVENLNRCRQHDIEVHISVNPLKLSYTNIWTFERLRDETEDVLDFLKENDFLEDTITTLVYDMEMLKEYPFPHYGFDTNIIGKLDEYDEVQEKFEKFNDHIRKEYDLKIKIVTDIYQAIDLKDQDNDLMTLAGLMSYDKADMSYMVYRRYNYGQNQILDHARFLNDGDTIILNAWRDVGYICWEDIKCAIEDCRLVLGYHQKDPQKTFRLEIWELASFLFSFGIDGLHELVEALNKDSSDWPIIIIWNIFPYSLLWDLNFFSIVFLDLYAPLFRMSYRAY